MVMSADSLAVYNWHISNPECNAQLSVVSARAVKHDRQVFVPSNCVQQVQDRAQSRQQYNREVIERFRKATIRRVQQQKSKCDVEKSQSESILRANIEQYKIMTENQTCRLMTHYAAQLKSINKAPLYRERDRVLAQSRSIRQHLLSFKICSDVVEGENKPADANLAEPSPRPRIDRNEPFWARVPLHLKANKNCRIQLSKLEQAQLAAAVRKWEMIQERHRARSEAKLVQRAKASSRPVSNRKGAEKSDEVSLDDGVQRLTINSIPSENAVRLARTKSYADSVRIKNRLISSNCPTPSRDRTKKQLLQRIQQAGVNVPALCPCGLTVFSHCSRTSSCTKKCIFYKDPIAFDRAVDNFLYSLEQCI